MKKYLIENSVEVYEDHHKDGEGDQINSWQNSTQVIAATPIDAVKKFFDQKLFYSFDAAKADFDDEDHNRIMYSNTVDEHNTEATKSELELFATGEKELFVAYSDIKIYEIVLVAFEQ